METTRPHVLAIPYPAQGHVIPLLELAQHLAKSGIRVTFVNTVFNHERIVQALSHTGSINELIRLVSIPDGMEPWEDRNDLGKLTEAMTAVMPGKLEALVKKITEVEEDDVDCVIADYGMGWAFELGKKFGIKSVAFLTTPVALLALAISTPKLVDEGIIDKNGTPLKDEMIQLAPDIPEMRTQDFTWARIGDLNAQKIVFHSISRCHESAKLVDRILCNSSHELEPGAINMISACSPVGPLLATHRLGKSAGYFWQEDSTCLGWLDQQPPNSTIYVAFGSFTVFDPTQFRELALGLERTNRPFLWVVRKDTICQENANIYPEGFLERIKNRGKIVGWAPQQKVLSHPCITCFLSHCGWNSVLEGISNGVPFLCWPYFADQFLNQTYISGFWKVGLELEKDSFGIVRQEEIKNKVDLLLSHETYKTNVLKLQAKAISGINENGRSCQNFNNFIHWIKDNKNKPTSPSDRS